MSKYLYTLENGCAKKFDGTAWVSIGTPQGLKIPTADSASTWFKVSGKLYCAYRLPTTMVICCLTGDSLAPVAECEAPTGEVVWGGSINYAGGALWFETREDGFVVSYHFEGDVIKTKNIGRVFFDCPYGFNEVLHSLTPIWYNQSFVAFPRGIVLRQSESNHVDGHDYAVRLTPKLDTFDVGYITFKSTSNYSSFLIGGHSFDNRLFGITSEGLFEEWNENSQRTVLADLRSTKKIDTCTSRAGTWCNQVALSASEAKDVLPLVLGSKVTAMSGDFAGCEGTVYNLTATSAPELSVSNGFPSLGPYTVVEVKFGFGGGVTGSNQYLAFPGNAALTDWICTDTALYGFIFGRAGMPSIVFRYDGKVVNYVKPLPNNEVESLASAFDASTSTKHFVLRPCNSTQSVHCAFQISPENEWPVGTISMPVETTLTPGVMAAFSPGEIDVRFLTVSYDSERELVVIKHESTLDTVLTIEYTTGSEWKIPTSAPSADANIFLHDIRKDVGDGVCAIHYRAVIRYA